MKKQEKAIENAELKAELRQEEEGIKNNLDAIIDAAGQYC